MSNNEGWWVSLIIILLIVALFLSFSIHMSFLVRYVRTREPRYLRNFITTAVSNVVIALGMIFIVLYKPDTVKKINAKLLMWLISGAILLLTGAIQVGVFKRIYQRSKLPEHFHLNFFGKKVLHSSVVKPTDLALFFGSMPFFLFAGAYFVARLINIILYGHL